MVDRFYRWLYTQWPGKKWTELIRQEQKSQPLLFMLFFLGLGIVLVKFTGKNWWQLLLALLFGVLAGHFWW